MPHKLFRILDQVTPGVSRSLGWEVLTTLFSFPASILLNRTLGSEERGLLALVILVPSTIFTLGTCQWERLLQGLITSKQISGKEAWRRTIYYTCWLSFIFIPIGIAISFIFNKLSDEARILSIIYYSNFPLYILGGSLSAIYIAVGSINGQYAMKIGLQGSYLFLLFILFLTNLVSVKSIIILYIVMHFISLLVGWFQKEKLLKGELLKEKPPIYPLVKSFFPYLLESFAARIDIWTFSIFGSLVSLGNYIGITGLMIPVGLLSNAMTSASKAHLDWTKPNLVNRYLKKAIIVLICLLTLLILGGTTIGPYLLNSVLGKSFQDGYWMIPWIAVIVIIQAATVQFHSALQLSGSLNTYLIIQAIEPLAKTIIILILGWWLSELGIMIGLITSHVLKIIACIYFQKKIKLTTT